MCQYFNSTISVEKICFSFLFSCMRWGLLFFSPGCPGTRYCSVRWPWTLGPPALRAGWNYRCVPSDLAGHQLPQETNTRVESQSVNWGVLRAGGLKNGFSVYTTPKRKLVMCEEAYRTFRLPLSKCPTHRKTNRTQPRKIKLCLLTNQIDEEQMTSLSNESCINSTCKAPSSKTMKREHQAQGRRCS